MPPVASGLQECDLLTTAACLDAGYKSRLEPTPSALQRRAFLNARWRREMNDLVVHGLYTVKGKYFSDFKRPYWMDNKNEHRPYYYLLKDNDGILWVIPLSSQTNNYAMKIQKVEQSRGSGNCLYYHIAPIASIDRVFLIGDMFPISEDYIKAPFTIDRRHYISRNKRVNSVVQSKAMRFLKLVEQGKIKSRNDIMGIKRILMNKRSNNSYLI